MNPEYALTALPTLQSPHQASFVRPREVGREEGWHGEPVGIDLFPQRCAMVETRLADLERISSAEAPEDPSHRVPSTCNNPFPPFEIRGCFALPKLPFDIVLKIVVINLKVNLASNMFQVVVIGASHGVHGSS